MIQPANVRAMLTKSKEEANSREALIDKEGKGMHQKATKEKAMHQKAPATSQGRGRTSQGRGGTSWDTWDWTGHTWTGRDWTGHWDKWW